MKIKVSIPMACFGILFFGFSFCLHSQEAQWIWHPNWSQKKVPKVSTYYRKTFQAESVEKGEMFIAADDQYELFLNNKKIGSGKGTDVLDRYDITQAIKKGKNVIAVRVDNVTGSTAAFAARVQVKEQGKGWDFYSTNPSWKVSSSPLPIWKFQFFSDSKWKNAVALGKLGSTPPWDRPVKIVTGETGQSVETSPQPNRQDAETEFYVEDVFADEEVGSIIAFELNEFGQIIASAEKGGLLLLDPQAKTDSARIKRLTNEVKGIQGILPLNGEIYVTGIYKNQPGLFLLKDSELDQEIDEIVQILAFKGYPGEHGTHGLALGNDGKIYVSIGNHVAYDGIPKNSSPYSNFYEGSIVKRYEDPSGHAKGIQAPGGTLIRTGLSGEDVEIFAGGLRNSYDLAFNQSGDLFTYDSDMETDYGMSWYRPTNLYHVVAGADYGWRSGWAKWPHYYLDTLPPIAKTGRGSPTGMVFYDHVMFPVRYQGTMFIADWSGGKIYNVALTKEGASYKAKKELFVEGSPLNVTDLAVGPDGALYFSTGGRMTNGGVYRVKWKGKVPKGYTQFNDNLSKIIRQPQPQSAFGRQNLAELRLELAEEWDRIVVGVALSSKNPENYRLRAIELMMLFGPIPSETLLRRLSQDNNSSVRAKAVRAMLLENPKQSEKRLIEMLGDQSPAVRRVVCESLASLNTQVSYEQISPLLVSEDRFESLAARKLLEKQVVETYRDQVISSGEQTEFIRGSLALIAANPNKNHAYAILARASEFLDDFISDKNFLEMLRLVQVVIELGEIEPEKIPAFGNRIAEEFPSGNSLMNRELARILTSLKVESTFERLLSYLKSPEHALEDRIDIALHMQLIRSGWTTSQKLELIDFLETQVRQDRVGNFSAYIRIAVREFAREFNEREAIAVIQNGHSWPNAAMSAFYQLPKTLDAALLKSLILLDRTIQKETKETYTYIKKGIIAVLAQGGGKQGQEYLREIWRRDEFRRKHVAVALSLNPNSENWPYLIASINEVDEEAAEVMRSLLRVPQKPEGAKFYRMVIVKAQELDSLGKLAALDLLEFWTGKASKNKLDPVAAVDGWKQWFTETYPDEMPAELHTQSGSTKWTASLVDEVLKTSDEFLKNKQAIKESKANGKLVFKKAQCSNCHRYVNYGESIGPDLTTVARRFTTKEILESIIHPSKVISDQYRSELIATDDGRQFEGVIVPGPDKTLIILQLDGSKIQVAADSITARKKSQTSVMPANLLETLTKQEIFDLFIYLGLKDINRIAGEQRFRTR
ncbi:MAG: HEAT repeat domain-containing protein [Planctomycetota bacterium]|nr:HEAT repeat domain-containing protein [Planctomycetota bacterium]